ncbi:MAG: 3-isopropylmalate dehydratase [Ignavibacteria bacterium]|nr:3-isopropylmalate dehydratase [Ignavibacteria bacterium]
MAKVVIKLGDDISTDVIYPGRYMATVLPTETPQYAFADLTEFNSKLRAKQIPPGSIMIGGKNFGCGSSREQAVSALKGHDLVIIAPGFARIFLQNGINLGLRIVVCPDIQASEMDEIQIAGTEVVNVTTGKRFQISPLPKARQAIIDAGGLVAYTRKRLLEKNAAT